MSNSRPNNLSDQQYDWMKWTMPGAISSVGGALGNLFGGHNPNPADEANKYLDQIPNTLHKNLDPWVQSGQDLMQHPGEKVNQIGEQYHKSPGFDFAMQQAMQGGNHAAAAGGMAGSPQHEQQNMQMATNLANQDYNNFITNAMNLHNVGYQGGQNAAMNLGQDEAAVQGQQAQYKYAGQAGQNQGDSQMWNNIFSGIGAALPFLLM